MNHNLQTEKIARMQNKALYLAAKGYSVFPLKRNTKDGHLVSSWLKEATNDPQVIKKWWTKWPEANIGLRPGPIAIVIDVDTRPGVLKQIIELQLKDQYTFIVRTPNGYHFYFKHPGGIIGNDNITWRNKYSALDIRADKGYVLAPGSVVSGKEYKVVCDAPLAPVPLVLLRQLPFKQKPLSQNIPLDDISNPDKYKNPPDKIYIGERDSYFWGLACSLAKRKFTFSGALTEAERFYARCEQTASDTFEWDVVSQKIERAMKLYSTQEATTETTELITLDRALKRFVLVAEDNDVIDLQAHPRSAILKLDNWKIAWSNTLIETKGKWVELPKVWLKHAQRKTVYKTVYQPVNTKMVTYSGQLCYNKYIPSDFQLNYSSESISYMPSIVTDHLEYLFNTTVNVTRFIEWLAYSIQSPEIRIPWAPLIISSYHGIGKGWLFQLFQRLFGTENCHMIQPIDLSDQKINFNEWLGGKLLWIDDLEPKHNFYERLKPIISETWGVINCKYGKKESRQLYSNVMCTSNHGDALHIDEYDRRLWVVRNSKKPRSTDYYKNLFDFLYSDDVQYLYNYLMRYNLASFKPTTPPPMTQAKEKMIINSKSSIELKIQDAYDLKIGPLAYDITTLDLVWRYVCRELMLLKDNRADKRIASKALNKLAHGSLKQVTYTVQHPLGEKRYERLILIRRSKKWCKAGPRTVVAYFLSCYEELLK